MGWRPKKRTMPMLLATAAVAVLAHASAAHAGTTNVAVSGGKLRVTAPAGSASAANYITVTKQGSNYTVKEQANGGTLSIGAQCTVSSPTFTLVTCSTSPGPVQGIYVDTRDGENYVKIVGDTGAEIQGGAGDDTLIGGDGTDKIYGRGGYRDLLRAGRGDYDELYGGEGTDWFELDLTGLDPLPAGYRGTQKRYDGGPGFDRWNGIQSSARIDLRGFAFLDDGEPYGVADTRVPIDGQSRETNWLRDIEGVTGSNGDDVFWGTAADENFYGLAGTDTFNTSEGEDFYACDFEGGGLGPVAQASSADEIHYQHSVDDNNINTDPIAITFDDIANDGRPGEGDNIQRDCENFYAGSGALTVTGSASRDQITAFTDGPIELHGGGGDDALRGSNGLGSLYGDAGKDTLFNGWAMYGGTEDDVLWDGVWLLGGPGNDTMLGGPRSNIFYELPGEGTDLFLAGLPDWGVPFGGPDAYLTKDGVRELVACGSPSYVFAAGAPGWGDTNDDYRGCF